MHEVLVFAEGRVAHVCPTLAVGDVRVGGAGHDDRAELRRYAEHFQADPERWLFLTGKEDDVYRLLHEGFHVTAQQNQGEERKPGAEVLHDTHLVLVDRQGRIRGYYQGLPDPRDDDPSAAFEDNLKRLRLKIAALLHEKP